MLTAPVLGSPSLQKPLNRFKRELAFYSKRVTRGPPQRERPEPQLGDCCTERSPESLGFPLSGAAPRTRALASSAPLPGHNRELLSDRSCHPKDAVTEPAGTVSVGCAQPEQKSAPTSVSWPPSYGGCSSTRSPHTQRRLPSPNHAPRGRTTPRAPWATAVRTPALAHHSVPPTPPM